MSNLWIETAAVVGGEKHFVRNSAELIKHFKNPDPTRGLSIVFCVLTKNMHGKHLVIEEFQNFAEAVEAWPEAFICMPSELRIAS